jgi:hypothetical protein
MGGGVAAGFLGSFGDAVKQKADAHKKQADDQKSKQADIYWGVIKNPDSAPEQIQYAQGQLQKLYGNSGPLKELFQKFGNIIQQTHPGHQQQPQTGAQAPLEGGGVPPGARSSVPPPPQAGGAPPPAPGAAPGGALPMQSGAGSVPPPPSPQASGGTATSSGGFPITDAGGPKTTVPPPPQAPAMPAQASAGAPTPKGQDPRFPEMAKAAGSTTGQDEKAFQTWKRQQDVIKQNKIEEAEATAKAKAAAGPSGAPPRPVFSRPTSVLDARTLAQGGKVYEGEDGEPIDVGKLPDNMSLQPFTTRITETDAQGNTRAVWKTRYVPISPDQRKVTVGNETYEVNPADASKIPQGAGVDLGKQSAGSTTSMTDPATGQTTTTKHVPTTTGAAGRGGGAGTSGGAAPSTRQSPGSSPQTPPSAKSRGGPSTSPTPPSPAGLPPLDPDGHITTGGTPQVLEGANQLLDGMDVNKLPAKTRDLSAKLARSYNWEQGKFTPKEQVMLKESTTFIDEALGNDTALKVLDEGWMDRQKVAQVVDSVDAKGMISRAITTAAAQNLTSDEAEFVRTYNQLVGTISGLGQLVRSGRATEATIERLKKELPNPLTTKDSADARQRLTRLRKEINVAMEKGTFTGAAGGSSRSSVKPPPSASAGQLSDAAKAYLDSQGIPH